jgi:drug/metabolite transporter (DMT)-like permease
MEAVVKKLSVQAIMLVLGSVFLGLISAWCLKEVAQQQVVSLPILILILGIVITLNLGRFMIWGYIHKRYPLSFSYPINSLFFPAILIMGYYYGESINIPQILGCILITSGVVVLAYMGGKK